jgi:multiple sugar transport system substrate-binding protein
MNKLKKLSAFMIVLLIVSVLLSACSGNDSSSTASGDDSKDGSTEIRIATWQTDETTTEILNTAKKEFEANNPDITIKIEASPYENYMTKLQTELAAGNAADIIQVGEQNFARYIEKEIVTDLAPLAEGKYDFNDIIPNVKELLQVDGKYPVMSIGAATIGVYYNKKMFDEAKLPYPTDDWTWEEFVDLAEKLTVRDGGKVLQYGANLNLGKDWVEPFVASNGGSYLAEDGSTSVGYLNSDKTVEAFQKISDLYNVSKVAPNPAELIALKGIDLFATGKVAMNVNGSWAQGDLRNNPDIEFGVVTLPAMSTGQKTSLMYTSGFGISSKSKNKEKTWEFLQLLTSPETEAGKGWAKSNLAVSQSLVESSKQNEDPILNVFIGQLDNAIKSSYFTNSYWGPVGDKLLAPAIQEILLDDKVDIKERLTDLTNQIDRELQQAAQ